MHTDFRRFKKSIYGIYIYIYIHATYIKFIYSDCEDNDASWTHYEVDAPEPEGGS